MPSAILQVHLQALSRLKNSSIFHFNTDYCNSLYSLPQTGTNYQSYTWRVPVTETASPKNDDYTRPIGPGVLPKVAIYS